MNPSGFLMVTVTPCASEITWSLTMRPERKSGYKGIRKGMRRRKKVKLVHFTTEARESFKTLKALSGIYTLSMISLHSDSHVKIYVTQSPSPNMGYPQLPANPTVMTSLKKRKLELSWPSGTAVNRWISPVEYCVSISQIKNFRTHCSLLAHKHGDRLPQYTRWGLPGEKREIRRLRAKAKPIRRVKRRLLFHQCIGNKTSFSYTNIKRGKKYFIDLFIVNSKTNQTSSYNGTFVERKKRKRKRSFMPIMFDETKTIRLQKNRGFEVTVNQTLPKLVFEVVPCSGKVSFALFDARKKRRKQGKVRLWKRIIVKKPRLGVYRMTFPGKRKKSSFVTVSVASKFNKSNVIKPKKRNIKIHTLRTSCSNVTLEWTTESSINEYCVYKRALGPKSRDTRKYSCLNPTERPISERVLCTSHKSKLSKQTFLVQSLDVTGLEPSTWYRFDVFIRNKQTLMIPYKSVKEKTMANCSDS